MENTSWNDRVRNEEPQIVKEDKNILHILQGRKANRIRHFNAVYTEHNVSMCR